MKQATLLALLAVGMIVFQVGCRTSGHNVQPEPAGIRSTDTDSGPGNIHIGDSCPGSISAADMDSLPPALSSSRVDLPQ